MTVRHGQGYTRYTHVSRNLEQDLLVLVPPDDPVKLVCLTVRNNADRPRRLSATFYAEWVLGSVRENAPLQVVCERDPEAGAVLARNAWAGGFAEQDCIRGRAVRGQHSVTADRAEFLGRNGSASAPAALAHAALSGRVGPALDPCAALMTKIVLAPGQTEEVVFVLGQAENPEQVRGLAQRLRRSGQGGAGRGATAMGPSPGCRPGDNARRRPGPDAQPLAALPGTGLPGLGAGRRFTNRVERTVSATSSRT